MLKYDPNELKTIVVKIGTSLLQGRLAFDGQVMEAVVKELCQLKHDFDINVVMVSSGAVGCGMKTLGIEERPTALPDKQAIAAVGQSTLIHYYETLFLTYGNGYHAAQVLLSPADLDKRATYLNVRNCLHALFRRKNVIPIINENDCTAVEELHFGDNDTLSAKVAAKMDADLLIILSDVNGLYDRNPAQKEGANLLEYVARITPEIEGFAGEAGSIASTGGMRTKLEAVKIACAAGVPVVITNGNTPDVIYGVLEGTVPSTSFGAAEDALSSRKRWIAFGRTTQGTLLVDDGAQKALVERNTSLLPAGITGVSGTFFVGDAVEIHDQSGRLIARALVNYDSQDILKIMGRRTELIEKILGRKDFDEVVHRDNLVVI
jgi:glutamate 5-kinase